MKNKLIIIAAAALLFVRATESATVLTVSKTPYEQFICSVDFVQVIGSDPFTLDALVAVNRDTGQDSTALIIAPSPIPGIVPATKRVAFAIHGGASRERHVIGVRVVDSVTGERFEGQIVVIVN